MDSHPGHTEKNTAILPIDPKADMKTLQDLRERFARFRAERVNHFILDLNHTEYVNSSVLAVLVDLKKRCLEAGASLTIVNVTDAVREILRTTKLADYLLDPA